MSNCNCVLRASSVTLKSGKYTVTVSDGALTGLCACECVEVGLFASIPLDSSCNLVEITDGTTTLPVYEVLPCRTGGCVADLWQTTLQCRSILVLRFAPASCSLTLQGVKGKRKCAN